MRVLLPMFAATWSDGQMRVIHANARWQAIGLARSLVVPEGVRLVSVAKFYGGPMVTGVVNPFASRPTARGDP